jgi:hypothetical protein
VRADPSGATSEPVSPVPLPSPDAPGRSELFQRLWPVTIDWVQPYYDSIHLFHTGRWLLTLDPRAAETLLIAAVTHDMERHFPGGTQPDKAAGAWADEEYNRFHCARSAEIVGRWLREQDIPEDFVQAVEAPILEHEFGGSSEGDVLQAADSISFLEVNGHLVSGWVLKGETSLPNAIKKLDWMVERIKLSPARELAWPHYERSLASVREEVAGGGA